MKNKQKKRGRARDEGELNEEKGGKVNEMDNDSDFDVYVKKRGGGRRTE